MKKTGLLKFRFPVKTRPIEISLEEWKKKFAENFLLPPAEKIRGERYPDLLLEERVKRIFKGRFLYFSSLEFDLGKSYDWVTNPENGYKYPVTKHWSEIPDFSKESGDIKYVWEKSRFCYIQDVMRYDFHFGKDSSQFVFEEICDWIEKNPVNRGPNWRCSQEISLRLFNWIYALHFYSCSDNLTDSIFRKIITSVYNQWIHVVANINFSRIAVRNNHAITETLCYWVVPLIFPFFPESEKYIRKGKRYFEQEINYQIYEDGTFLQYSMNYHRVVVQLLTLYYSISKNYGINISGPVHEKAKKSFEFLFNSMELSSGKLPNYGANDGALFFRFSDCDYRDFRPQLNALYFAINEKHCFSDFHVREDVNWFFQETANDHGTSLSQKVITEFRDSGYYIINEPGSKTFLRCGSHLNRPSQADNLHLDLWAGSENILPDSGSYKYNTDIDLIKYFNGTEGHNTVMLGNFDQMLKGPRFIWYYWTESISSVIEEKEDRFIFKGKIRCYSYINRNITHTREVVKYKGVMRWEVTDEFEGSSGYSLNQLWHVNNQLKGKLQIKCSDLKKNNLEPNKKKGWISSYYGLKEETDMFVFASDGSGFKTTIEYLI